MRKTIAAATIAASLAAGGLVGSALGGPSLAGAVETATDSAGDAAGWVQETLGGLVDDGTITQDQADAVQTALDEARPDRGPGHGRGHHGGGVHVDLSVVAESLGITTDELRTALHDDQPIADVAAAEGVDVATVVDAIVVARTEHINTEVTEGELTQAEADEILADVEERATAFVNGERPTRGRHHRGPDGDVGHDGDDEPTEDTGDR